MAENLRLRCGGKLNVLCVCVCCVFVLACLRLRGPVSLGLFGIVCCVFVCVTCGGNLM